MELVRQGYIRRGLAILFLMFAFADLVADTASPELCCEGINGFALSTALENSCCSRVNDVTALTTSSDAGQEQHPDLPNNEENCIFCCAHILPGLHFDVAMHDVGPPATDLTHCILPTAPPQRMFHPPRLA